MSFGSISVSSSRDCYQLVLPALIVSFVSSSASGAFRRRWFVSLRLQVRGLSSPIELRLPATVSTSAFCLNLSTRLYIGLASICLTLRHTEYKVHTYHILHSSCFCFSGVSRHLYHQQTKLDSLIGKHPRFRFQQLSDLFIRSARSLGVDRREPASSIFIKTSLAPMSSTITSRINGPDGES